MEPVRDSSFLPAIADYLARDFITAFIMGAALAFVMHSSVAAILMCVTLVQIDAIPFPAALSLLLGANLGSAFIPIWLTRGMTVEARRIPVANLLLRGSWALVALLGIYLTIDPTVLMFTSPGQSLVYAHIGFNLSLLVIALPFCRSLEAPINLLMPVKLGTDLNMSEQEITSALDPEVLSNPKQSIASLKRELLRMTDLVDRMFQTMPQLYESGDREQILAMRSQDEFVNTAFSDIRSYVASMPAAAYRKQDIKIVRGLMDYAIRLEAAGDIIAKKLTAIAKEMQEKKARFSDEGWMELVHIHEAVSANLKLACNVLISDDVESAHLLATERSEIKKAERKSRKLHLARLHSGREESFESSNMHLETLRALRDINGHISAIAYPILNRNGQLLETSLKVQPNRHS